MLNACPKCQRTFPAEDAGFCPVDATKLVPVESLPLAKDANDPFVGHTIVGKYELRRVVADGGMGRVYEARQLPEQRRIAVKILHADVAEDPVNIERFRREAETSRALDHTHIVDVIDFAQEVPAPGRAGGAWYLAMEYLDGEELRALIDREKIIPMPRVVRMMSQAAIALDGAHASGAVHRDMKPDNIFLVRSGVGDLVKILDFGSVKFTKGQDRGQKLTVMGTTIGSPFYMSPEQAQGLPDLDHRADVWALGAILYEMTVGKVPFQAPSGPQILFKILSDEPMPPTFAKDDAPPQLDDIVTKALAKKRDLRYQSCSALADALGHAFGLQGTHRDWAVTSERDLEKKMHAASAAPSPHAAPVMQPMAMAFPSANAAPAPASHAAATPQFAMYSPGASSNSIPDDYNPIKKAPVVLYAAIGLLMLALAIVSYFALR